MTKLPRRTPVLLAAAVLLASALIPVAVAGQEKVQPSQPPQPARPRLGLNLSPDQVKALEAFRAARRERTRAFRDDMAKLRAERDRIFTPEQREKLNALRSRLAARGAAGRARLDRARGGRFFGPRARLRSTPRGRALRLRLGLGWRRR